METVRFHITQAGLFSGQKSLHLVGPCEQFSAHETLSWSRVHGRSN